MLKGTKFTTYYNGVKKADEEYDVEVILDRRKMEDDYDRYFNRYYNPTEKRTGSLSYILQNYK